MDVKQRAGLCIGLIGLLLGIASPLTNVSPTIQTALGMAVFALAFWTFEPVPIEYSSLLLLLAFPLSGLLSFEQSFAPFAGKTVWLIFAGMALSMALSETGIGELVASALKQYISHRPAVLIVQLHAVGLAAAFLVPSGVVRVLLLMPIGLSICSMFRGADAQRLTTCVLLSLVSSTIFGGFGLLTGAVPNLVIAGQVEHMGGEPIFWSTWFVWMFPLVGLARTALSAAVIWLFFARNLAALSPASTSATQLSISQPQRKTLAILTLGVGLWATDTLHQIPPVFIALFLVLLLIFPRFGPLNSEALGKLNFPFLFYIAALFSLGTALDTSGFNQLFIRHATQWIELSTWDLPHRYFALTLLTVPLNFAMDIAAVAAVLTQPYIDLALSHGMDPMGAAMGIGMATTLVFLPYQAAPFMVAYSFRRFPLDHLVLTQCAISTLSLLLIYPLNPLLWHYFGLI